MKKKQIKFVCGLPTTRTEDKRDFKVHQLGGFLEKLDISNLPKKYIIGEPELKDQGNTLFCTLFSSSTVLEPKEGVVIAPEWWAKEATKDYGPNWINEGLEQRRACKLMLKGALEAKLIQYPVSEYGAEFVANPANYSTQQDKDAIDHTQGAFFEIKPFGGLDLFDSIRYTLWKFRDEKRGAVAGTLWDNEWTYNGLIENEGNGIGGHQIAVLGWEDEYLIIQNSYGSIAGNNGRHLFNRSIVNRRFNLGVSTFKDCTDEEIERLKSLNNPESWFKKLLKRLKKWYNK